MKKIKILSKFTSFLIPLSVLLCIATLPVVAQTPDGDTPAEEVVCDQLLYSTPGLYGLCVAYCEAQDLNDIDFNAMNPEKIRKAAPNRNILKNYRKKMLPGDPDMPCLKVPCPCWDESDLENVTVGNVIEPASCSNLVDITAVVIQNTPGSMPGVEGGFAAVNGDLCATRDLPPFGLQITSEEYDACRSQIVDRCADIGIPFP